MSDLNKLTEYIKEIPLGAMSDLIGNDVLEGLQNYDLASNKTELARIIIELKGNDLFYTKGFLKKLLFQLKNSDYRELSARYGKTVDRKSFSNWRNDSLCKVLLDFFDLGEEYLVKEFELHSSEEIVTPFLDSCDNNIKMFPLHDYQKGTKDRLVDSIERNGERVLLHMPTGSGKTKTMAEALVDFWRSKGKDQEFIVWLAHSKELCEQAYDTFKMIWKVKGDYPLTLFRYYDKYEPNLDNYHSGIVFAGFDKLFSAKEKMSNNAIFLRDNTRVIVIDEAHRAIARTYKETINYLTMAHTRVIGLTATPGRNVTNLKENSELAAFFNNNKIAIRDKNGSELDYSPVHYLQKNEYLAKLKRIIVQTGISLTEEELLELNKEKNGSFLSLATNDSRNDKIISEIVKCVKEKNYPTLVFATSISHAVILEVILKNKHGISAGCILGNTSSYIRERNIQDFKENKLQVLINYEVLTTGFDAPNIRALVICRPTSSIVLYSQMIGRALRGKKMGGAPENENILIDIIDNYGSLGNERESFDIFNDYFE